MSLEFPGELEKERKLSVPTGDWEVSDSDDYSLSPWQLCAQQFVVFAQGNDLAHGRHLSGGRGQKSVTTASVWLQQPRKHESHESILLGLFWKCFRILIIQWHSRNGNNAPHLVTWCKIAINTWGRRPFFMQISQPSLRLWDGKWEKGHVDYRGLATSSALHHWCWRITLICELIGIDLIMCSHPACRAFNRMKRANSFWHLFAPLPLAATEMSV